MARNNARFGGSRVAATSAWESNSQEGYDDGIVVFEESQDGIEFLDGSEYSKGYLNPYARKE